MLPRIKSNKQIVNKEVRQVPTQELYNQSKLQTRLKGQFTIYDKMQSLQQKSDNLLLKVITIQQQIQKFAQNQYKQIYYSEFNVNQSSQSRQNFRHISLNLIQRKHQEQLKKLSKIGHQKVQMISKIEQNIKSLKNQVLIQAETQKIFKQKNQLQSKFKKYYEQKSMNMVTKSKSQRFQLVNGQIVSRNNFNKIQKFQFSKDSTMQEFIVNPLHIRQRVKYLQNSGNTAAKNEQSYTVQIEQFKLQFQQYRQRVQKKISIYQEELNQCYLKQQLLTRQVQKLKYQQLTQKIIRTSAKRSENPHNLIKGQDLQKFKTELNIKFVQENKSNQQFQEMTHAIKQLQQVNLKLRNDLTLKECQQLNKLKRKLKQKQQLTLFQKNQILKLKQQLQELFNETQEMNFHIVECKQKINMQSQTIDKQLQMMKKNIQQKKQLQNEVRVLSRKINIGYNKQKQLKQLNRMMLKQKQEKPISLVSKNNKIRKEKICSNVIQISQIIKAELVCSNNSTPIQIIPDLSLDFNITKPRAKMMTTRHPPSKQNSQFKIDRFQNVKQPSKITLKKLMDIKFNPKQEVIGQSSQIDLKLNISLKLIKLAISVVNTNSNMKSQARLGNRKLQSLRPDKILITYKNQTINSQKDFLLQSLEDRLLQMKQDIENIQFSQKQYNHEQISNQKNLVYLSPQVLLGMNQFQFSYCWTLGIIIDQIFHHKIYYGRIQQIIAHKNNFKFDQNLNSKAEKDKLKINKIKHLVQKMIVKNYKERLKLMNVQDELIKIFEQ